MTDNQAEETRVFDQFGQADEFERPADGPIGLHRGKRALLMRLLPYVITIVLAVALGLGTWLWRSGTLGEWTHRSASSSSQTTAGQATDKTASTPAKKTDNSADSAKKTTAKDSDDTAGNQTSSPSKTDSGTDSTGSSSTAPAATTPDLTKSVIVYNATNPSINGLAATKVGTLKSAGYTAASAKNPSSKNQSSVSVVWYKTADDLATAKDIATKLGIQTVQQAAGISSDIAVYLK